MSAAQRVLLVDDGRAAPFPFQLGGDGGLFRKRRHLQYPTEHRLVIIRLQR